MTKKSNTLRAQISLEFLFIFGLLSILLVYSVRNVSFSEDSPSAESLRIQIVLEEKSLANAIASSINQVYAQGPGAKVTTHVKLTYLKNKNYVEIASKVKNPIVFITYCNSSTYGAGVYVFITNDTIPFSPVLEGDNRNMFYSNTLYSKKLSANSSVWTWGYTEINAINPIDTFTLECGETQGTPVHRVYGISTNVENLPSSISIVVEWNPAKGDSWSYNITSKELRININPGG